MPKISEQQKEAVRVEILNAAREVFIEKGFEAASMKEIVGRSGKSFGGVYMYYSNKEGVFLDLLRRQYVGMSQDVALPNPKSGWDTFRLFLQDQERRVKEAGNGLSPSMYEYFIVGRRDSIRRKWNEERRQAVFYSILGLIHDGVKKGEFNPSIPVDTIIHFLISFLEGIFLESIITGPEGIGIGNQFVLLEDMSRSILMPLNKEESK
ncbi:TetR family transcriptional regulator [Paenibacillus alginolyticus]|uniref:TetR family transcriptional regulator n=1 Tax=Paenibacillus alginolyticus TaxID=59839 RepID=A0ABT4G585_9BACL|nr:TetR family transcriptional regulator [Paenibacillus alginolyticus]MCY9669272.1 TetR family transcriptional regulator [Paenibacillus alginolyticus]MCY9691325.1 TetR family transcriptional regulator [Paenibacillus alginolyticus]MEC0147999.1 TetR family transcriptional regulator [Paenibacillus alginolyticus]